MCLRAEIPGSIQAQELVVQRTPDFLDYIQEGCDLTFSVAVDFTASNKSIQDPASLHHIAEGVLNQYQQAIMAVGPIGERRTLKSYYPQISLP